MRSVDLVEEVGCLAFGRSYSYAGVGAGAGAGAVAEGDTMAGPMVV